MQCELKLWLDYSADGDNHQPTNQDLARLFSALRGIVSSVRVQQSQYGYISILNSSLAEIAKAKEVATHLHIPICCGLEERFSRRELRQARFVPLALEGDHVDMDADANPLNRFPSLLCPSCRMPDEGRLPSPFYVSARQMCRRSQDGVPGSRLQPNREMFWCGCGVMVAADRLKYIFDVVGQSLRSAPVAGTPRKEIAAGFQVLRPIHTWGRRQNAASTMPCPHCGRAQRCHINPDVGPEALYSNRIVIEEDRFPDCDLLCSETWYGDRTRRPSESADFIRDVYVSGRLYDLLLRAKVRGLVSPNKVVAFQNTIPMAEPLAAQSWVDTKLKLLEKEGLL